MGAELGTRTINQVTKGDEMAERKTRSMGTIFIATETLNGTLIPVKNDDDDNDLPPFETTADVERWVRNNGAEGFKYVILRRVKTLALKTEVKQTMIEL